MGKETKQGVLLLAFGGADSLDDVEQFVKNVLKGRPVTQELIDKAKERYRLIGGSSPLLKITTEQARLVKEALKKSGMDTGVYVGMRYWRPYIKDALSEMAAHGVTDAIAVIMSPFSSNAATGGYLKDVEDARSIPNAPNVKFIPSWHTEPLFIEIVRDKLIEALASIGKKEDSLVIFSCHSLPVSILENDPYVGMIASSAKEAAEGLGVDCTIAYQSAGAGPRAWLGPTTEEVIVEAAKQGKKSVVICPFGFVADHVETLYDIDILFNKIARENNLAFARSASLNDTGKFIDLIAGLVKRAL